MKMNVFAFTPSLMTIFLCIHESFIRTFHLFNNEIH